MSLPNQPSRNLLLSTILRCCLGAVLVFVCLNGLPSKQAAAGSPPPPPDAGLTWLQTIDQQRFDQSWDQASVFLKEHITKIQWHDILHQKRLPLGAISSRNKLRKV